MDNSYFSQAHGIEQVSVNKKQKKSVSISTLIISVICVAFIVVLFMAKLNDIKGHAGPDNISNNEYLGVGDEVSFSGIILNDGDMQNYTHTYQSLYGTIGLKSSKFDLNKYDGIVYFEGIVEKIYHDIPIVDVDIIYLVNSIEETGNSSEESLSSAIYLSNLGLYFPDEFFDKYSMVNQGDGSVIKIKNLETNVVFDINYFKCNDISKSNENCNFLNDFYSNTSVQSFTDKYGLKYYKDLELNSRFFSNDSVFGFRINDPDESVIRDLYSFISVVNKKFVDSNVKNISTLCSLSGVSLKNITSSDLLYKKDNTYYNVSGNDGDGNNISCSLIINPISNKIAIVDDIEITKPNISDLGATSPSGTGDPIQEVQVDTGMKENTVYYDWDSDIAQFPVNLAKSITFTSSRGHSFVFPSSNIAYQGVSANEDFGQVGVNCFSVMNVVQYSEKEFVSERGNVKIYECSIKNSFDDSDKTLIYKHIGDKHFVIQIVNPARVDFANNIEISA